MKTKQTATIILPSQMDPSEYYLVQSDLKCTNVIPKRDRTPFGQRLYQVYFPSDFAGFNTSHHIIVNNRRYAIQDITRIPEDSPRAYAIGLALYDPDFDTVGIEVPDPASIPIGNLVAFYEFSTAAGQDVPDSHNNADTLTDVNTVGRVTGLNGNAADFNIANNQYFWISPAAGNIFEFSGDFSICAWIKIIALPEKSGAACYQFIFSRVAGYKGYSLRVAGIGMELPASIGSDNPAPASAIAHGDLPSIGDWQFVCLVNKASIQIESWFDSGGVMVQSPGSSPIPYSFTQTVAGYADTFIGMQGTGAISGQLLIDSLTIFDKALSNEEIAWMYNNGTARSYTDM